MTDLTIKIKGADSAHRTRMKSRRSEIWRFPDGIQRLVTMSKWHWDAYDWMMQNRWRGVDVAATTFEVYEKFIGHPDFERALIRGVAVGIEEAMKIVENEKANNDNSICDNLARIERKRRAGRSGLIRPHSAS